MKAKKLIEVALPIKEISAESVRDKSIRHGTSPLCICGGRAAHCQFAVPLCLPVWFPTRWTLFVHRLFVMRWN